MSTSSDSHGGRFVPKVGAIVAGKYRIERKLGEGGMGLVVAASHLSLGGQVALKFLSPGDELRQDALARFTREAQSVARIKSEHVARVLDMGKLESGEPFIVMELLEGTDLHKFVRKNGPLPVADAVEYVLQAAEGVADAHAIGIVHRDLKPANLFLSHKPDGSPLVRVLDFGIAKNILAQKEAGDVSLTVGTEVLGSPLYMSPEQIRNPKDVDPRADVWSLGAILYKLLTGRAAFEADNPSASLAMIVMEEPTPLRQFRPDVPSVLESVIHRCLEKKLDRRFQTVDELACALMPFAPVRRRGRGWVPVTTLAATNVSMDVTVPSRQTNAAARRPRPWVPVLVALSMALGITLAVVLWIVASRDAPETTAPAPSIGVAAVESSSTARASAAPVDTNEERSVVAPLPVVSVVSVPNSSATPANSSSAAPMRTPKRTDRNAALDDRL